MIVEEYRKKRPSPDSLYRFCEHDFTETKHPRAPPAWKRYKTRRSKKSVGDHSVHTQVDYVFEPDASVLDRLLPRLVETMVYQAILESAASNTLRAC